MRIRDLRGPRELLCHDRRVIVISPGPNAAVRRSSLAHAVCHLDLEHGDPTGGRFDRRQENAADQLAARRLIPLDRLLDVVRWTTAPLEACEELQVDLDTLQCRVDHLHPSERGAVRAAFAERE